MTSLSDSFRLAALTATAAIMLGCEEKHPAAVEVQELSVQQVTATPDDVILRDISLIDSVDVYDNEIHRSFRRQVSLLRSDDPQDVNIVKSYGLWLRQFDDLGGASMMDKIEAVNRTVNRDIVYTPDNETSGMADYAPAIAETLSYTPARGDCEDMALAKYAALEYLHVDPRRLKILLVGTHHVDYKAVDHAVLAVDTTAAMTGRNCLILDIGTDAPVSAAMTDMKIFYSVDPVKGLQRTKTIRIKPR